MKRLNHFDNEHVKNFDESLDKPVVNQGVLLNFNVSEVILYKLLNQQLFNTKVSLSAHFPFRSSVSLSTLLTTALGPIYYETRT